MAFDDSDILAFADDGRGGNIRLNTPAFFGENFTADSLTADPNILDGNDRVDINATGAVSGTVVIPDLSFLQNSLADLADNTLNTDVLLASSCVTRTADGSAFLITGSGGLPERPGDAFTSSYPTDTIRAIPFNTSVEESPSWDIGDPIEEPQGLYQLSDGRVILSQECSFE